MAAHDPLRKCPNPECESKPEMARYQCYRVCCEGCGMEGPMAVKVNTKNEAARLWNLLPREDSRDIKPMKCPADLDPAKDCPVCGEPPDGVCKAAVPV